MANKNLISTVDLIEKANAILREHQSELDNAAQSYKKLISSAKLPSTFVSNLKDQETVVRKLTDSNKKLEQSQKELQRERLSELKLHKKREQAFDRYEKQLERQEKHRKKEIRDLQRQNSRYQKIQRGVNALTRTYNDLAIKKELGLELSVKEEAELLSLTNRITKYQNALKKVDADIGKHQRNVGNYASGFDGLGNSINQITRELPAFANSAQTGFLAISNNLPILFDELQRIKLANKELIAQGKPVKSVFSQLGAAVFSFGTALSLGVTLLTLYGKDIVEWGQSLFDVEKKVDILAETQKFLNEQQEEGIDITKKGIENAKDELSTLELLARTAENTALSQEQRQKAVDKLQELYPDYLGNLSDEAIKLGKVSDAYDKVRQSILKKATIEAAQEKLGEFIAKRVELQLEQQKAQTRSIQEIIDARRQETKEAEKSTVNARKLSEVNIDSLGKTRKKYDEFGNALNAATRQQDNVAEAKHRHNENIKQAIGLVDEEIKSILDLIDSLGGLDPELKKITHTREKQNSVLKDQEESLHSIRIQFIKQIDVLKKLLPLYDSASKEGKYLTSQINFLEEGLKDTNKMLDELKSKNLKELEQWSKGFEESQKLAEKLRREMEKLKDATNEYLDSFRDDVFNSSGLSSLTTFFDGTFDKLLKGADTLEKKFAVHFNAITEVAQEAFSLISKFGQENFNAQYDRLQLERDTAIKFAGENTAAKEEIEKQYEQKRKSIQIRQARAEKNQALFNIAIDTAQGIVATIGNVGFPGAIPLIALIAALGAAQAAVVSSTPIPEFWQGGEVGKSGTIMVNDDPFGKKGRNYKEVVETPSGRIIKPQGKNVKMNVPKGTIVHPTYSAFLESLDNNLQNNGIMPFSDSFINSSVSPIINVDSNSLSKDDYQRGVERIISTMNSAHGVRITVDENGMNKYIEKNNQLTKVLNNVLEVKKNYI